MSLLTWLILAPAALAGEKVISPGASVQAAIDAAQPGDTIKLAGPGIFAERLTISKPLRLAGEAGAVLDGGGRGTVLRITGAGVVVEGLVVRGSGRDSAQYDAGLII